MKLQYTWVAWVGVSLLIAITTTAVHYDLKWLIALDLIPGAAIILMGADFDRLLNKIEKS